MNRIQHLNHYNRPYVWFFSLFFVFALLKVLSPLASSIMFDAVPPSQSKSAPTLNSCTLPISNLPATLDPRKASDATSGLILRHIYEGLTRLSKDNIGELALASECKISSDRKTYTFKLKESYWNNGVRLVAQDFVNSWASILDPSFPSPNAYHLFCIEGAQAVHERTLSPKHFGAKALDPSILEITLKEPNASFLEILAFDVFYPVYIPDPSNQHISHSTRHVSNGPFSLISSLEFGKDIVLKKNPHFWNHTEVSLDKLHFCKIQDPTTALELFRRGELDWVGNPLLPIPIEVQLHSLNMDEHSLSDPLHLPISYIGGAFSYWITLNCETAPFKAKEIRQAMAACLESIDFSLALGSIREKSHSPLPNFLRPARHSKTAQTHQQEPSDPKKLFMQGCQKLKITPEQLPHLTYIYNPTDIHHLVAQVVKEQIEKQLPIKVVLQSMEWQSLQKELKMGSYIMARNGWRAQIPDPLNILEIFQSEEPTLQPYMHNFSRWSHPDYDKLLTEIGSLPNGKAKDTKVEKACSILAEELPVIPLFFDPLVYYKNPALNNVQLTELGRIDFSKAFFNQNADKNPDQSDF